MRKHLLLTHIAVPVAVPVAEVPVRDEPAVAPLRAALRISLALAAGPGASAADVGPDAVLELLGSWFGGADAVAVRRLRQALLASERARGGARGSEELLVAAVTDP